MTFIALAMMYYSVLFPAVMIKILNFGTCFITSMPIKTQNNTYKSISLTSLKTQWNFVLGFFEIKFTIFVFFRDGGSFVVVVAHLSIIIRFSSTESFDWDYKQSNWRVNIFIKFFVHLLTKSYLIFVFFVIFSKKSFTLHVCSSQLTMLCNQIFSHWPSLQAANAAKLLHAESKTSIWSKLEYGEFFWKNTTQQNGLAFYNHCTYRVLLLIEIIYWDHSIWNKCRNLTFRS